MRIVVVTFLPGVEWGEQRKATETAPGWHVADYSMDRSRVRLTYYDDAKAVAAVRRLSASPHVADVHLKEPPTRFTRRP
jgi:hypothetical protein